MEKIKKKEESDINTSKYKIKYFSPQIQKQETNSSINRGIDLIQELIRSNSNLLDRRLSTSSTKDFDAKSTRRNKLPLKFSSYSKRSVKLLTPKVISRQTPDRFLRKARSLTISKRKRKSILESENFNGTYTKAKMLFVEDLELTEPNEPSQEEFQNSEIYLNIKVINLRSLFKLNQY